MVIVASTLLLLIFLHIDLFLIRYKSSSGELVTQRTTAFGFWANLKSRRVCTNCLCIGGKHLCDIPKLRSWSCPSCQSTHPFMIMCDDMLTRVRIRFNVSNHPKFRKLLKIQRGEMGYESQAHGQCLQEILLRPEEMPILRSRSRTRNSLRMSLLDRFLESLENHSWVSDRRWLVSNITYGITAVYIATYDRCSYNNLYQIFHFSRLSKSSRFPKDKVKEKKADAEPEPEPQPQPEPQPPAVVEPSEPAVVEVEDIGESSQDEPIVEEPTAEETTADESALDESMRADEEAAPQTNGENHDDDDDDDGHASVWRWNDKDLAENLQIVSDIIIREAQEGKVLLLIG